MVKAKKFILVKKFDGLPKKGDVKLVSEELPAIKNGEFLAEAHYLSVDPYQRAFSEWIPIGGTIIGSQVAKIIESKNDKYPVGQYVVGEFGWRTHTISNGEAPTYGFPAPWLVPDSEGLPLYLGALGMPGVTAYFGLLEICQPKEGETVVVTGAAGAVGCIVGQIAKIKGCKVIGIAGSDQKGRWLVDELKFDHFVNYKDGDFVEKLAELTPDGVDCYFDNVGGELSSQIIRRMNNFGRIAVCGSISTYNDREAKVTNIQLPILSKQLKMEGFLFIRWWDRLDEAIKQLKEWMHDGKILYRGTVTEGFENMFLAFVDMLTGKNMGKAVVTV